jgi:hypothetical protein
MAHLLHLMREPADLVVVVQIEVVLEITTGESV